MSVDRCDECGVMFGHRSDCVKLKPSYHELERQLAEREKQVEILTHERDAARHVKERTVRILMGIHALLYPPIIADKDGKMWQFKSPIIEEQMQLLSDRIRDIPDEIEVLAATEQNP